MKSFYLTPLTKMLGVGFSLLATLLACQLGDVSVQPPAQSSSQLTLQHRLTFKRSPDWLQTANGQNLIAHGVISDPSILYENGRYRMWFTAALHPYTDAQELGMAYAESQDGQVWQPHVNPETGEPLLLLRPTPGGWDAEGVETPSVIKTPDGKYWAYYTGSFPPAGTNSWAIGLAVSEDGLTWTKVGDGPVLEGRGNWEGPFFEGSPEYRQQVGGVLEPAVLYDTQQKLFKMWYSALGTKDTKVAFRVGYATSIDGIAWEANPQPVLEPDIENAWDDAVVSHTNVVPDPTAGFHLFYFGASAANYQYAEEKGAAMIPGAIGHAFSRDGLVWQKDANPVLNIVPDSWQAWMVGGPTALVQNNQIKLWYFGSAAHDTYEFHLGFASAPLSP